MHVLYSSDPLHGRQVDPDYEREHDAAQAAGFTTSLISYEALVAETDADRAVRRVEPGLAPAKGMYRGWMLRPDVYGRLYDALLARGLQLINTPEAYRHCHYLPASYQAIADMTPRTVWIAAGEGGAMSMDDVLRAVRVFGAQPIIVKDYVRC